MNLDPRVFVLTESSTHGSIRELDLRPASKFGKIQLVYTIEDARPGIWDTDEYANFIEEKLVDLDFKPEVDYFCLTGPLIYLAVAQSVLHELYGPIKFLLWDAKDRVYRDRVLGADLVDSA